MSLKASIINTFIFATDEMTMCNVNGVAAVLFSATFSFLFWFSGPKRYSAASLTPLSSASFFLASAGSC